MTHPYQKYEKTETWKILSASLDLLCENQDISIKTRKEYVIGYLCNKLNEEKDLD